MNKFLVIGTGSDINDIDFKRIDKSFITAGVNKVYKKVIPDYFYIYDLKDVLVDPNKNHLELPDEIKTVYCTPDKLYEYFYQTRNYKQHFCTYYDKDYTPEFNLHGKTYECNHSSINYLMRALNDYLYAGEENIFYMIGVPLLERIGHFYDDIDKPIPTTQKMLDRFYNDFIRLKDLGYKIISLMTESRLNDLFPKENIEIIYGAN
jgi:hypothetical protein